MTKLEWISHTLILSNNSLLYFPTTLYCPDRNYIPIPEIIWLYRYNYTGNGNYLPVLNYFWLPITGNGRNSIMVALTDWRITLIFLLLEKLSSPSRSDPGGLLLLAVQFTVQMETCDSSPV
jgi:hypothetical protein